MSFSWKKLGVSLYNWNSPTNFETQKKYTEAYTALKNKGTVKFYILTNYVRNDNLNTPKSQNTEPESSPGQNPLQTARPMGWEPNNPPLIDKVVTSSPGPNPLAVLEFSVSKLPVQDANNFSKVPTPDTGSFLGKMHKFLNESYSKLPKSPRRGTEPEKAPNT
ncbi:hypothetical protein DSO57_1004432 [Entomophthora muscae]|uniref:Uncharacterized protein n=1 Tax=Entomophthora muscae TaxID=34485 RepID=A0ACC2TJ64_9FUNG|nr:hypothetical protein DSO57_1004432 [Entomophthora muscae]